MIKRVDEHLAQKNAVPKARKHYIPLWARQIPWLKVAERTAWILFGLCLAGVAIVKVRNYRRGQNGE